MPGQALIELKNVEKTFMTNGKSNQVLKDINLEIQQGEIFGIIGFSGAGKSTLVRCINGIEVPTSGEVRIGEEIINQLKAKEVRTLRKKIGMIFQQFNLMPSRTTFENVALPLKKSGLSKQEINQRVLELLTLVGLEDKKDAYPAQLSGGQKQRVAIARALANKPQVLLCDEATSALDPQTTKSILQLLKELNLTLGLTIVLITHEMSVIKEICHKVAVIDRGVILEEGDVFTVFSNPKKELTRLFIETTSNLRKIANLIADESPVVALTRGQVIIKMTYIEKTVSEALISEISRKFDINANIISGDIEIINDSPLGGLITILDGNPQSIAETIAYLEAKNIEIEVIKDARIA